MRRRTFLRALAGSAGVAGASALGLPALAQLPTPTRSASPEDDRAIRERIDAHRPSRLAQLPPGFAARVGAAHVGGLYHLSDRPFLLEGAEKLLELGTRLGKLWFTPDRIRQSYRFHSRWPRCSTFVELAETDHFQKLFALPFSTLILEAQMPAEWAWKRWDDAASSYPEVTQAFHDLTAYLYRLLRDRPVTVILQHWEGDWLVRGLGASWAPPPDNWKLRFERMARWLAARQAGVASARAQAPPGARCRVAHATEVNRVVDLWRGIPTMTEHVLPSVEVDLVSYSCYDAMQDGPTLWRCLREIQTRARTTPLFGKQAVYVGEVGIPENDQPQRVRERWDELLGAMLAADVGFIAVWQLYCNEASPKARVPLEVPVTSAGDVRGYGLVRPDGSLGETGQLFRDLWRRA